MVDFITFLNHTTMPKRSLIYKKAARQIAVLNPARMHQPRQLERNGHKEPAWMTPVALMGLSVIPLSYTALPTNRSSSARSVHHGVCTSRDTQKRKQKISNEDETLLLERESHQPVLVKLTSKAHFRTNPKTAFLCVSAFDIFCEHKKSESSIAMVHVTR